MSYNQLIERSQNALDRGNEELAKELLLSANELVEKSKDQSPSE